MRIQLEMEMYKNELFVDNGIVEIFPHDRMWKWEFCGANYDSE